MISNLKQYCKKSIVIICIYYILVNLRIRLAFILGDISSDSGTTHQKLELSESLNYIEEVFQDYKTYGKLDHFYGRVCEVGPGDNLGVALNILADGATQVDCTDRFFSRRDATQQDIIYEALANQNPNINTLITRTKNPIEISSKIKQFHGKNATAELFFKDKKETYDIIVSRSVLEHVTSPLEAIQAMWDALKPGGKLIHKVDLRDHGMFSSHFDELTFLHIPRWIYRLMTHGSGYPNRILIQDYQQKSSNY